MPWRPRSYQSMHCSTSTLNLVIAVCSHKELTAQLQLQSTYKVLEVGSGMGTCATYMAEVS